MTIRLLNPKQTYEKFGKKKSWLWDTVKNNPSFPRPVYLAPGSPVFVEHELDEYILGLSRYEPQNSQRMSAISKDTWRKVKSGELKRTKKYKLRIPKHD